MNTGTELEKTATAAEGRSQRPSLPPLRKTSPQRKPHVPKSHARSMRHRIPATPNSSTFASIRTFSWLDCDSRGD